jgi:hypothetical protein
VSLIDRSTLHFLGVFLGMSVVLAGVAGFFALHDTDWRYSYDRPEQQWEGDHTTGTSYYDQLSSDEQRVVDRAIGGETFRFETEDPVPPKVVKKNGTYHVFDRHTVFDFLDPGTSGPALVSLAGGAVVVLSVRADVRH